MNSQTSVKSLRNRGKGKSRERNPVTLFVIWQSNDRDVKSHHDIANALADNVLYNSSSAFSTEAFTSVRQKAERQNLNILSENLEE